MMNSVDQKLAQLKPDLHAYFMALALEERSIPWHVKTLCPKRSDQQPAHWLCFQIKQHDLMYCKSIFIEPGKHRWGKLGRKINHQAQLTVSDKNATKQHLQSQGINTPKGQKFRRRELQKALDYFGEVAGPLCVKPNNGNRGHCVTSSITSFSQYEKAVRTVAEEYVHIVVEEHVEGEHFRFFFVEPDVIGVRKGVPLSVVGDGLRSIEVLLAEKNQQRKERNLVTHPQVAIDSRIVDYLDAQGLTTESVVPAGKRVFLRSSGGYPEGADTILLDKKDVHPDYLRIVAKACQSVQGLHFSGVDIVIKDVTQPASDQNYWILELNSDPAFVPFYYPWEGEVVDVAGHTIDMLLRNYPFEATAQ